MFCRLSVNLESPQECAVTPELRRDTKWRKQGRRNGPEVRFEKIANDLRESHFWTAFHFHLRAGFGTAPRWGSLPAFSKKTSSKEGTCKISKRVIEILDCRAECI
jgi:hypothetical protein